MEEEKTMIPCMAWIPRGFARTRPKTNADVDREMQEMMEDEDLKQELEAHKKRQKGEYEEMDEEEDVVPVFANETLIDGEAKARDGYPNEFDDDSEDDVEDYTIKKHDCLVVAGKIEDEFSQLEVYIYEEKDSNMYVHHDVMLSAFPICIEWLAVEPSSFVNAECDRGNLAIVGAFMPHIEIWDLDVLDSIEPKMVLVGVEEKPMGPSKKKKSKKNEEGHSGAVISLNLNKFRKNILASSSDDHTVKVWDLATGSCAFSHALTDTIVDTLRWDLSSESVLFSASDDGMIRVSDIRVSKEVASFKFDAKIENFSLDPFSPSEIVLSFDNGSISGMDLRHGFQPLFSSHVSGKAVTSISHNPHVKGMLCTTSLDGTMSVYNSNIREQENKPKFVCREFANMGNLFGGQFNPDLPLLFGCGSSKGELVVWAMEDNKHIKESFSIKN